MSRSRRDVMPDSMERENNYIRLFTANVLGVLATGLATVALALLAYDLAGRESGAVLGTALALKMAVDVVVPPFAPAISARLHRKTWLTSLCAVQAGALVVLTFARDVWQVYALVVVFQMAAASFRTGYVATVPDMVRDRAAYAAALAKARIAYNLESVLSPLVAAALLSLVRIDGVFVVSALLLLLAALVVLGSKIPARRTASGAAPADVLQAFRKLFSTGTLRGGLAISAAAVVITAMVVVNTIVLVRGAFSMDGTAAAIALAVFAAGGIVAAAGAPSMIERFGERAVMLWSGVAMTALLFSGAWLASYPGLLALWVGLGATVTLAGLPVEALVRRFGQPSDRETLYAGMVAVNSVFLMIGYAAAGWVGAELGLSVAFMLLAAISAALVAVGARWLWLQPNSPPTLERGRPG